LTITYKVLGQVISVSGSNVAVYTAPINKQAVLSTISICNQGLETTFRLAVHDSSSAISSNNYIIYNSTIASKDTVLLTLGITLKAGETVSLYAGTSNVSANIFGVEKDSPTSSTNIINSYVRPTEWPTLTTIPNGTQKFQGVYAVFNDSSNFVALSATGNYTVDWGDGSSTENISSGVQAQHQYTYSSLSSVVMGSASTNSVTFTDAGDLVNWTAHGLQNGTAVSFSSITSTTGISINTIYYVVNKAADNFQVSSTVGGSALALTTNGSGLLYFPLYKTAVVTVIPNGGNLTGLNFSKKHSQSSLSIHSAPWLDIDINSSYLTSLTVSPGSTINLYDLEIFKLNENAVTNFSVLFVYCYALKSIPLLNTSSGTNFSSMFYYCRSLQTIPLINTSSGTNFLTMFCGCYSLQTIPLINTSNGTNFSSMFNSCYSLQTIPLINTSNGTNFSSMFNSCYSLQTIPLINTSNGTNFSSMFNSCYPLQTIPLINTSNGTNFSSMFNSCIALQTIPLINTSNGTNFSSMFNSCIALQTIPLINTSLGTNFSSMFDGCRSLRNVPLLNTSSSTNLSYMFNGCSALDTIPLFNTSSVTTFAYMFNGCYSLQTIPLLNTASGITFNGMFSNCTSLQSVPLLNTGNGTSFTSMFGSCTSLAKGALSGTKYDISYSGCKLSATELDDMYTNLASGVTSKTVTVTGNWGTSTDTPSIATGKGWTVTG
jgi:surface protein